MGTRPAVHSRTWGSRAEVTTMMASARDNTWRMIRSYTGERWAGRMRFRGAWVWATQGTPKASSAAT